MIMIVRRDDVGSKLASGSSTRALDLVDPDRQDARFVF